MANILVTGSNGQLGSEIRALASNYRDDVFYFTDRETLDITSQVDVEKFVVEQEIDVIVNCAAYTAVDNAESDVENADRINHLAVKALAEIAKANGLKLLHISTDYVFDGTHYRPYVEDDEVKPASVYGETKCDGEEAMLNVNPANSIIVRTSWVYSSYGANFVKTMLRLGKERDELGVIFDQVGTPTYAKDLARTLLDIISRLENDNVEVYHYSNEGVASWYDFAREIMEMAGIECRVNPIETVAYPTPAKRPHYSLMNKGKIKTAFGLEIPYWKESLKDCLKTLGEIK
jgi:dTDP-4-dehydrorhamnose reductase